MSLNQPDLDLLADYVGGALDGTPDEQRVGERIRSDAEWARAYADLVTAFDRVSADLRAYGRAPEPMPDAVWDQLEAALSSASPASTAASSNGGPAPIFTAPRDNRPPGRAAKRRRRVSMPVLAAVAVLFVLTLGIFVANGLSGQLDRYKDAGAGDAAAPAAAGPTVLQRASGRDYTADNLALATDFGKSTFDFSAKPQSEGLAEKSSRVNTSASYASAIPVPLMALTREDRLADCLNAVTAITPGQVLGIDYATYERTPAAMIVVRTPDDGLWVGVVGADCGTQGADLLTQKRLN